VGFVAQLPNFEFSGAICVRHTKSLVNPGQPSRRGELLIAWLPPVAPSILPQVPLIVEIRRSLSNHSIFQHVDALSHGGVALLSLSAGALIMFSSATVPLFGAWATAASQRAHHYPADNPEPLGKLIQRVSTAPNQHPLPLSIQLVRLHHSSHAVEPPPAYVVPLVQAVASETQTLECAAGVSQVGTGVPLRE
jgi:hypothetical protein